MGNELQQRKIDLPKVTQLVGSEAKMGARESGSILHASLPRHALLLFTLAVPLLFNMMPEM